MTKLAKIALVGTAFSVLTIGLSFFTNPSVKAVPLASNVNVVNTTRNPVPIQHRASQTYRVQSV